MNRPKQTNRRKGDQEKARETDIDAETHSNTQESHKNTKLEATYR